MQYAPPTVSREKLQEFLQCLLSEEQRKSLSWEEDESVLHEKIRKLLWDEYGPKSFNMQVYLFGSYHSYFGNGGKFQEFPYKDGKKHGIARTYYEVGDLEAEFSMEDGKLHGMFRRWFIDGRLESESVYESDRLVSMCDWDMRGDVTPEWPKKEPI